MGLIWMLGQSAADVVQNYSEAKRIFLEQEKRMERDPKLREEYIKIGCAWLQVASFVEVPKDPLARGFYIRHFMVIRLDKTSTKYRLVMHGVMKFKGFSINHFLEAGPNQVGNLLHILLRLRQHPFVLTGDIEVMFMRIRVRLEDCEVLRIFFHATSQEPLRVLEGRKHLFGLACSPFVAVMTVKHHAVSNQEEWPLAFDTVMRNLMVDDFCIGSDSLQRIGQARKETEALCESMEMRIHKYAANSLEVLEGIPKKDIAKTIEIGDPKDKLASAPSLSNVKTLGMLWISGEDVFTFR